MREGQAACHWGFLPPPTASGCPNFPFPCSLLLPHKAESDPTTCSFTPPASTLRLLCTGRLCLCCSLGQGAWLQSGLIAAAQSQHCCSSWPCSSRGRGGERGRSRGGREKLGAMEEVWWGRQRQWGGRLRLALAPTPDWGQNHADSCPPLSVKW